MSGPHAEFILVEDNEELKLHETLHVVYKGSEPPPDTFKDNAQALAMGVYKHDGVFYANELQAKCASKYAPQQGAPGAGKSNMSAVPRTSTIALTNATLPYTRRLASLGFQKAIEDPGLAEGVNVYGGAITYKAVAESQGRDYTALSSLL